MGHRQSSFCQRCAQTCSVFFIILCEFCVRTSPEDHNLFGWKGDTYDPKHVFGVAPERASRSVKISDKPLAFIQHDLLSTDEARHFVRLAAPRMKRSMVGGGSDISEVRTSYGMFIPRYQDAIVARLEERVAEWTGIPVSHQEDIQVLRYAEGQQYKPHMDSNGRICTVLIYLVDTPAGGETAFPATSTLHWVDPQVQAEQQPLGPCAEGHVAVKPRRGTGLLFWSMPPEALHDPAKRKEADRFSEHTGCPPLSGFKWTLTIWIHYEPFRPNDFSTAFKPPMVDPGACADLDARCQMWAAGGECERNAGYMVGGTGSIGNCRKACKACTECPPGEQHAACVEQARTAQGFLTRSPEELKALFGDL